MGKLFDASQLTRRGFLRRTGLTTGALALGGLVSPFPYSKGISAQPNGRFIAAVSAPPRTMNPYGSDADSNLSVMSNIFEGLLQRDASGELKPALATDWTRVDELTWRFKLRKGVKFHNGNDFTWEDVKFSFERMAQPEVSEFLSTGQSIDSVTKVSEDPVTIDIKTKSPIPWFDQNLHQLFIMDKESTETRSTGEVAQQPIGTGPYRFVEWVKGSNLDLEVNDNYWGELPEIKQARLRPLTEPSTRLAAMEAGEVDLMKDIPVRLFERAEEDPNTNVVTRPSRRAIFLGLRNSSDFPASDLRVREAIYRAINEPEIIASVMNDHAAPAAQIPDPPTIGFSEDIDRFSFNLERARQLLEEAGFSNGFNITLTGPNDRYVQDEQIAQAIATQLSKVDINVELDVKPKAVYFDELPQHELDFYLLGWFDGAFDFGRSYGKLIHTVDEERGLGTFNAADYSAPDLDQIWEEANQIVNPKEREKKLQQLNRKAMEEQISVIPLHYQQDTWAIKKGAGIQFTPRPDGWVRFIDIGLEQ